LLESSSTFKRYTEPDCSSQKQQNCSRVLPSNCKPNFNQEFLEDLHQLELDDWGRYGKARQRWEKELSDPDDVFIHAEERKKQLAKQRKKTIK